MFGKKCYEGGQKHKFQPRYTEKERESLNLTEVKYISAEEFRDLITLNIYVHDVCVWCGKVVKG